MCKILKTHFMLCTALGFLLLAGCAGEDPYVRLKQTEKDYRDCLAQHQGDEKICTATKSIYEAEQESYQKR